MPKFVVNVDKKNHKINLNLEETNVDSVVMLDEKN